MSVKDSALLIKLKDGIQDTVVFLRMLEQFKIPAVMETKRKKLLEKLLNLQGDTIKETPPSFENGDASPASPTKDQGELTRKSSLVENKVSAYSRIQTKAKEEMSQFSPKKAATANTAEIVKEEEVAPTDEGTDYLEPASIVQLRRKEGEGGGVERPSSTVSAGSGETEGKKEETATAGEESAPAAAGGGSEGKAKKKRGLKVGTGGLKGLRSKIGKFSSKKAAQNVSTTEVGTGETESVDQVPGELAEGDEPASVAAVEGEPKEEKKEMEESAEVSAGNEEEQLEEGVRIQSHLEKRVPKRLGKSFNWLRIMGKLKETTLILIAGSKEKELELVGCMVSPSDAAPNGIELFSHKEQKQWVFRVDTGELRERWVEELQKAIDACPTAHQPPPAEAPAPAEAEEEGEQSQEKPTSEEVPEIKIEPVSTSEENSPRKRASIVPSPNRTAKNKPVSEIPEQGIQIKGYIHRKKGTFGGWERAYAVVTYAAIYFTSGEEVKEYHHVCLLNGSGTVKMEKKGHDKQSEGLLVKSGKNKETLSLPSSELASWRQVMEEVLGVAQGNLELDSDEEGDGAESTTPTPGVPQIEEDLGLYEELPAGEEIEEDIYEEFDDAKPSSSPPKPPPSLPPPRPEQQRAPSPALPPRNDRSGGVSSEPVPSLPTRPSPNLPPRNSPIPSPKTPQAVSKSPAPPPSQPDDGAEELYEDVVAPPTSTANDVAEEMYEDIVAPTVAQGGGDGELEELYEDVVSAPVETKEAESPTEDYTEMDLGPAEEYVLMEKPQGEEDLEVYCEVDPNSPPHAPVNSLSLPAKSVAKPAAAASKIMKPPPPASYTPRQSGNLSHKAPKKSKFYEEWCAVEGTNLCMYKSQKDKRTTEKLSLSEFDIAYSPAGKEEKFAFRLTKGDKVHHFTPGSKGELTSWITALRGLAKSATLELPSGEPEIYKATVNHSAESDEQISFKAGAYIRIISRNSSDFWIGQLGSSSEVFTGQIGKFPASKVSLAEDLYI